MLGERVVLLGDSEGRLRSFVTALERFPAEPEWVVVGGFAVNVRVSYAHRLTNDLDTVSRDQTEFVDILVETPGSERVGAGRLRFTDGDLDVNIDVMADTTGVALVGEPSDRAFALARRLALVTAEPTELVVIEGTQTVAAATAPVATSAALVALKAVAMPRRASSASPAKVGSDIHDLVRLVQHSDIGTVADEIAAHSEELRKWVAATLLKWFSPGQDLRYTHARLRRLTPSPDAEILTEDDLALVARFGDALLDTADPGLPLNEERQRIGGDQRFRQSMRLMHDGDQGERIATLEGALAATA